MKPVLCLILLLILHGEVVADDLAQKTSVCRELIGSVRPSGEDGDAWQRWRDDADRGYRDCRGSGMPLDVRVRALLKYAIASDTRGQSQAALAAYQEALGLLDASKGKEVDLLIEVLDQTASLAGRLGMRRPATEYSQRALDERTRKYGPKSAKAIEGMVNHAMTYAAFEEYDRTEKLVREAVRVAEGSCGPQCEARSIAYVGMQSYFHFVGNEREAARYGDMALDASPNGGSKK